MFGQVLVNVTTHDKSLQTDKIDYDPLPAVPMKGMDEPVRYLDGTPPEPQRDPMYIRARFAT